MSPGLPRPGLRGRGASVCASSRPLQVDTCSALCTQTVAESRRRASASPTPSCHSVDGQAGWSTTVERTPFGPVLKDLE